MTTELKNSNVANSGRTSDRFLRLPEVLERCGVSKMTIIRWEGCGRFPKRVKIGANTVVWRESEIERWIAVGGSVAAIQMGDE